MLDACAADRPEMACNLKLGPMAIRKGSKVRIVGPNGVGKVRVFHQMHVCRAMSCIDDLFLLIITVMWIDHSVASDCWSYGQWLLRLSGWSARRLLLSGLLHDGLRHDGH